VFESLEEIDLAFCKLCFLLVHHKASEIAK